MHKTKTTVLIATTLLACGILASLDADARGRNRNVQRGTHHGSVSVERDNARGESQRQRNWERDGQGNASGSTSHSVTGANGGSGEREGSYYRNADGSAGHQGSVSATNSNGGTLDSSGGFTRDAEGNVDGSRSTTATNANGGTYTGSTTVNDGQVTHTGTVTTANGGTTQVDRDYSRDAEGNLSGSRTTTVTGANGGSYTGSTTVNDGQMTHTATRTTANGGTAQVDGSYSRDADGNISGGRSMTATGANGGTYSGSTTVSDGQLTHTGTKTGANGGTVQADGSYSRGEDGKVDGGRTTSATGPNGATYSGSTTVTDGQVTHTGTCTNADGVVVDCPQRNDGN